MNVVRYDLNGSEVAEMQSDGIIIRNARDADNVIKQLLQSGVKKLILHEKNMCPEMWQPRNGMAEAILKEFAQSAVRVAFVGEFYRSKDKRLQEFIKESNQSNRAVFVDNIEVAKSRLSVL